MRVRATHDLALLADPEFFAELETGIALCATNSARLMEDVALLAKENRHLSARILQNIANEEAAKALILLDAARCPRDQSETRVRHLKCFAQHLAKGLYTLVVDGRAWTFRDVRERIDRERKEFYLDGPDGGEWAFSNYILTSREQAMYVDYIVADESKWWHDPTAHHLPLLNVDEFKSTRICSLVSALNAAGCFSAGALEVIAKLWRATNISDSTTLHELQDLNVRTLRALEEKGLLRDAGQEAFGLIGSECPYPLYSLDLGIEKLSKQAVLDQRTYPADYY